MEEEAYAKVEAEEAKDEGQVNNHNLCNNNLSTDNTICLTN